MRSKAWLAAPVLLAHAEVTNIKYFSMGPKLRYPVVYHLQAAPLLNAVATVGPIAITVDASAWSAYESGVFDGCSSTNIDLDHAVQLVGECVNASAPC